MLIAMTGNTGVTANMVQIFSGGLPQQNHKKERCDSEVHEFRITVVWAEGRKICVEIRGRKPQKMSRFPFKSPAEPRVNGLQHGELFAHEFGRDWTCFESNRITSEITGR